MKFGLTEEQYERIIECFKKFPQVERVVLFGSRAIGNYRPSSDIDLILYGKNLKPSDVSQLFGLLNDEVTVPFQFDLLNQNSTLPPELAEHIKTYGIFFYPIR